MIGDKKVQSLQVISTTSYLMVCTVIWKSV